MSAARRSVFAGLLLHFVNGCTAATFDVQDYDQSNDAEPAPSDAETPASSHAERAPHFALTTTDAAAPRLDTATADTGTDTAGSSDTADGSICRHACLIAGSSGANLRLGSTACTWDGECCSGSCYVVHPGTGEHGTCVAPGGASLWCGGTQEWCPEAVTAGVARCAS